MADPVMKAPVFEKVLAARTALENESVALTLGTADKRKFEVEFSATCAPLAIAALSGELGKLLANIPEHKRPPTQPVLIKGMQLAMRDNGAAAMILILETGAELPLEFPLSDLSSISEQFAELARLADPKLRH